MAQETPSLPEFMALGLGLPIQRHYLHGRNGFHSLSFGLFLVVIILNMSSQVCL
jgi:hypothetical protein